ncbi:MAG: hypothetical protein IJX28_02825 [Clostridia bacterium]|nr:hypothetical protein [Clostridia bacterium]
MYEYAPGREKRKEKRFLLLGALCAIGLFAASRIPGVLFPWILQFLSVALGSVLLLLASRCLLYSYVYRVGDAELTIVEYCGKRRTVVCRIYLSDILSVEEIRRENRRERLALCKGGRVYSYLGEWFPSRYYLLTVRDGEERFYLKINADSGLLQAFSMY